MSRFSFFNSSFSLVDNIKSHRQAKKGLRKEKDWMFVSDRGGGWMKDGWMTDGWTKRRA